MWPKIHSNRDPGDTLFAGIQKEFGQYFKLAGDRGKALLKDYPKTAFYSMVVLMAVSLILSFTLFREREKESDLKAGQLAPVSDGFGQLLETTGKIRETISLRQVIDSLSAKSSLAARDSLRLNAALDRLRKLSQH
ncbi:hypothetical protein [Mucilaginibacter terrae]|uniref:Methyl-accepting chemotaxis protein n=1 Tax=Mucilaginibacter terrae TaxID=1955052 RepID=A0ABU3GNC6_9SPHI|nr:hypothetical protein [Mucilaginibacter terrae]MDT3401283.1 hypothetical protein [Mucilaginibacter terrae]